MQETADMAPSLRAAARFFMFSLIMLSVVVAFAADLFAGVVMLSAGLLGWRGFSTGLIKSILAIIGILAMYAWAVPLGKLLASHLRGRIDWPFVPIRHLSVLLVAAGILLSSYLLGTFFTWWYRLHYRSFGRKARLLGMCMGMAEGVLLSTVALAALLAIEPPARMGLSMVMDDNAMARGAYDQLVRLRRIADSTAVGKRLFAISADQREVLEMGGSLAVVSKYQGALDNLKRNEMIVNLIQNNPAIDRIESEIRQDHALKAAVKAGDLKALLNSSTVVRLLDDKELAQAVKEHRNEIFEAIMVSVPAEFRDQANEELAKLRGMPVKEFKTYAEKRIASLKARPGSEAQLPFGSTNETSKRQNVKTSKR